MIIRTKAIFLFYESRNRTILPQLSKRKDSKKRETTKREINYLCKNEKISLPIHRRLNLTKDCSSSINHKIKEAPY